MNEREKEAMDAARLRYVQRCENYSISAAFEAGYRAALRAQAGGGESQGECPHGAVGPHRCDDCIRASAPPEGGRVRELAKALLEEGWRHGQSGYLLLPEVIDAAAKRIAALTARKEG